MKRGKLLKISDYTHYVDGRDGNVVLYNAIVGSGSLCKISKQTANEMKNIGYSENWSDVFVAELMQKGHLISSRKDEIACIKDLHKKVTGQPTLKLIILPTEKCNFRCIYCYESYQNGKMRESVVEDIITFVKEKINDVQRLEVEWFGGEPLIEVDRIEQLTAELKKLCCQNHKSYVASITTNGYMLTGDIFKRLYRCHVLSYQITIDGLSETHDIQRPLANGSPTFKTIVENLLRIKNEFSNARVGIILRTNCSKDIMENLDEYLKFMQDTFGDDKRFSILLRPVMDLGGDQVNVIKQQFISYQNLSKAYEIMEKYNFNTSIYHYFLQSGSQVCYAGKSNQYTINSVGEIYKCTCDFEHKDITRVGTSCSEINEEKYNKWISELAIQNEQCRKCFCLPICFGDFCPNKRLIHPDECRCPIEYFTMDSLIRLLDSKGEIRYIEEIS